MIRSIRSSLILIAGLAASLVAADPAKSSPDVQPAWPQENGPFGNFNPRQCGVKLVDDPNQIKMVWISEEKELGMGRAGVEGFHRLKYKGVTPGTSTGLILAEGKVFASSCVPTGTAWAEKFPGVQDLIKGAGKAKATSDEIEAYKLNSRLDADDFTVAIDAKTGKTVWKSVEAGKGVNVYPGKRSDMHNTPVYHQGRIFSLGTTGLVYCYDAGTGRKVWEDDKGRDVKPMAALKAKVLRECCYFAGGMGKAVSPVVAEGILIVPQYAGMIDTQLRGLDVATGRTLWETTDAVTGREATPAVWTYQGRQYLVVGNTKGELRMLDPRDGKTLWTVTDLPALHSALVTSAKHVFVSVKSKTAEPSAKGVAIFVRVCAYRITPEKAERAWETPDLPAFHSRNVKDTCSLRKVLVRDGLVYDTGSSVMNILKEETGEPVYVSTDKKWHIGRYCMLIEDRLMCIPSPSHRQDSHMEFWTLDPKDFHQVGANYHQEHARPDRGQLAAGYDVHIELPYADGFIYMRGYRGDVVCYDLRK